MFCNISNKTGLQPVSSSVKQFHYFEGWGVGAKPTLCKVLRTGSGARCIKVGTKVCKKLGEIEGKNQPMECFKGEFTYTLLFCILGVSFRGGGGKILELISKTLI